MEQNMIRVAVASRDGRTVAGHIGKCADWIVFEADMTLLARNEFKVNEVERITLPKELVFHHYTGDQPHPLQGVAAVIGASAGDSFVNKMQRRGIEAVLTAEPDPAKAVEDYLRHSVVPAKPRPIGGLICKLRDALSSNE